MTNITVLSRDGALWDWRAQMRARVRTGAELAAALPDLQDPEGVDRVAQVYPMAISPYYLSLIDEADPRDPIFRQCVPQPEELLPQPFNSPDPLHEQAHSPVPRLVHRYANRALCLTSTRCAVYCRHCTRKRIAGIRETFISPEAVDRQICYLHEHPEVDDVILSGGDPLTMPTKRLEGILAAFRAVESVRVIRIGSRVPVTLPMRITDELCEAISKYQPVWLCTHFNHPREITPEAEEACERLVCAGIPVLNQTVLLHGVNDNAETLGRLFASLFAMRVQPYYLFQCDLVQGVEHLRTPLRTGIDIMSQLRQRISGPACPQFIVDAPDGGGKIPVAPDYVVERRPHETVLRSSGGKLVVYPDPVTGADDS